MVTIAKLTEKLELQTLSSSANTYGEQIEVWQTFRIIYGTQNKQKGKLVNGQNIQSSSEYIEFYCRYTPVEKKGTRVIYNDEYYKITNINHVPFREATVIELTTFI